MKALATNTRNLKFCIVGVAKDIQDLMKEHESADRLFAGTIIALDPMSGNELKEIISIAETAAAGYFTFSDDARNRLVQLAQGHPYLVHLIGKVALRDAYRRDERIIDSADIETALQSIAENGSDPVLEGRYRIAVASSSQRETVFKSIGRESGRPRRSLDNRRLQSGVRRGCRQLQPICWPTRHQRVWSRDRTGS